MKILIVAMSNSIHTARWISQITDQGWGIHLFPSIDIGYIHPDINNVTVYHSIYGKQRDKKQNAKCRGVPVRNKSVATLIRLILKKLFPNYRAIQLRWLITKINPDIVHSMEIQHAGYLTLEAKKMIMNRFPPWIVTNWGSDIYLFGRLSEHKPRIREVLGECNYYSSECYRDVTLAKDYGLRGKVLSVMPNSGGFDLAKLHSMRHPGLISERKKIALKGYQGWSGRALVALRALERCSDVLQDYEIVIYKVSKDVLIAAELFAGSTGVSTTIVSNDMPREHILKLQGNARISIGLSISDGVSTSFLESLVMGSFPIQSNTSCCDEWIEDGKNGFIVPPEDPEIIEKAIRRALTDDDLVNTAAEINFKLAKEKLDQRILKPKAIKIYKAVARDAPLN